MTAIRLFHIDLNLLLTLAILLETRSVSRTARRLGASQPTASRSLARLRDLFGDPLLVRTNHGMELTRRAEELIEPLREWLTLTNGLFVPQSFDPSNVERRFRIASTDFGVMSVIAPALPRLHQQAPGVAIDVVSFSNSMFAKLTSGEIDLIVSGLEPDQSATYSQRVFREAPACLVHADHPLTRKVKGRLTIDEFLEWPHISVLVGEDSFDRVGAFLGPRAAQRRVIASLPYFQTAPALLDGSNAIVTLPKMAALRLAESAPLAVFDAPEAFQPLDYWILWRQRNRSDPATMWLVNLLSESCLSPGG